MGIQVYLVQRFLSVTFLSLRLRIRLIITSKSLYTQGCISGCMIKRYNVLLDPEKVDILRKSGTELSLYLRTLMAESVNASTEGTKVQDTAMGLIAKRVESIELKMLKMDTDFKTAQNHFNHAFRRIVNAMRRMGIDG